MTFVFEVIIGLVPPLKGAFDKFNIIPPSPQKKLGFLYH